jgi:hypothetical protein
MSLRFVTIQTYMNRGGNGHSKEWLIDFTAETKVKDSISKIPTVRVLRASILTREDLIIRATDGGTLTPAKGWRAV